MKTFTTSQRLLALGLTLVVSVSAFGQSSQRPRGGGDASQPAERLGDQPRDPSGQEAQPDGAQAGDDVITISQVSEPLELRTLVELIEPWLDGSVAMDPGISGAVVFTKPVRVPREELLTFVASLLEMQGYAIYKDPQTGLYNVVSAANLPVNFEGMLASTRVIETPNVRPSSLKSVIEEQIGTGTARITYLDELGMIIVTGTPGNVGVIENLVNRILEERSMRVLERIELDYISAPVARMRLLELVGQISQKELQDQQAGARGAQRGGGTGAEGQTVTPSQLENLDTRLVVASSGNALLFRGREREIDEIRELISYIDVLPGLVEERYFTGTQTEAIARYASHQGLGEVIMMGDTEMQGGAQPIGGQQNVENLGGEVQGGSRIVADIYAQHIVYYGTEAQQAQMSDLVDKFEPEQDLIVVQPYKLYNADALTMADLINALLTNEAQVADAPLLGQGGGGQGQGADDAGRMQQPGADVGEGGGIAFLGGNVFVVADEANNQLLVKAPQKQQIEFERLIKRLDLRRPQVFLDVQIVAVTWTDDLQLGVELQGINANGSGGAGSTNFGLSSFPNGFTGPKEVATNLLGLTAAVVNSDEVPIIINAVRNTLDGRIISSPKLLVDDNEESSIKSVQNVPIQTVNQGQITDQITFGGYEEAGTTLTVTPSISEGGQVRLNYEIILSDFVGQGSGGLPPPVEEREISSEAVTVPSDMTVVIGGIEINDTAKTKIRVPLLGDIPLIGLLFGSNRDEVTKSNLYVFITPRVLRDPTPVDYRLLTKGPQATAAIDDSIPQLQPIVIPIIGREEEEEDGL